MTGPKLPTFFAGAARMNAVAGFLAAGLAGLALAPSALAAGFCTQTADAALTASQNDARVTFFTSKGICINETDAKDRTKCNADAQQAMKDDMQLAQDQHTERLRICGLIGEDRYDPEFDRPQFVDPAKIGHGVTPNPYFPLVRGTLFTYKVKGQDQITTDLVTDKTKKIDDVTCVVVEDRVKVNGVLIESTDDWFAQDLAGNVWYCGELAEVFETFKGDRPQDPELTTIDGSFKADRNGDRPGLIAEASPQVGDTYYEEFSLNNAEDAAQVVSLTASAATPAARCNKTCLMTRNTSSIDLDVETKFYAPGVGLILEVEQDGTRNDLISVTH